MKTRQVPETVIISNCIIELTWKTQLFDRADGSEKLISSNSKDAKETQRKTATGDV